MGVWDVMYKSPEFNLRSRARTQSKKAQEFSQGMAQDQWDWHKQTYWNERNLAKGAGEAFGGLVDQYNQSYAEAKAANEQRYGEIVGIADTAPDQRSADIRSDYAGRQADSMQRLAGLGMANTTVAPTMGAGIEREKQAALDRSTQAHAAQRIGVRERRTDEYPDQKMILSLLQSLGQGGGGAGMTELLKALSGGDPGAPGGGGVEKIL